MTLIIYDNTGRIWVQMTGSYEVPTGIPYLEVEVPTDKYVMAVDLSGETPTVVYAESPKTETALLKEQVDGLTLALAEMMGV